MLPQRKKSKVRKLYFIISLIIHLGVFAILLNLSSVGSPEDQIIEVSIEQGEAEEKQESKEELKVIPKGDTDALGKECPYTYGGIGIQSGAFDVISVVYEGYAADRAGLKVGDIILSKGEIRGEPGTSIYIRVLRQGTYIDFTIIREKICYDL